MHDVLQVLARRYPLVEVVLAPTSVQGDRAAGEICTALARLTRLHQKGSAVDTIIVARGGGPEHDLAVFNDERVARAFFACPIPIVSAIGHETDFTLVDYVADLRAPTPSAAAELITPEASALREMATALVRRGREAVRRSLDEAHQDLRSAHGRLLSRSPAIDLARRRTELRAELRRGLASLEQRLSLAREQVHGRALQLEALSPERTIERGYAICTIASGQVLRSIYQVAPGNQLDIRVVDGLVVGQALERRPPDGQVGASVGFEEDHGVPIADV
jgi:exodeoxyribonuclease VII large subunit